MRKLFLGLLFGFVIGVPGINAEETNAFSNPTLGFAVTKPAHWQVVSAEGYAENLGRVKLEDEEFQEKMQKYAQVPFIAFMKYPEPYDDVNPSFKVNIKPLGQFLGKDSKEIINTLLPTFKQAFRDFQIIEGPMDVNISGIKSAYVRIHYTMAIPDGRTFPTCSELWIIPRGNSFFMIGIGRRQDASAEDLEDIKQIVSSIKIDQQ